MAKITRNINKEMDVLIGIVRMYGYFNFMAGAHSGIALESKDVQDKFISQAEAEIVKLRGGYAIE